MGHIAHLNLREELLPFKFLIGRVLLDVRFLRLSLSSCLFVWMWTGGGGRSCMRPCSSARMSSVGWYVSQKIPNISTVVNKIGNIESEFRGGSSYELLRRMLQPTHCVVCVC